MTSPYIPTPTAHSWRPRPIVGWTIRIAAFVLPALASLVIARLLDATIATAGHPALAVLRWLAIAAFATVVIVGGLRLGARLAPIAALFTLTLSFPDRAPSRFRLALRAGTTRQLRKRIAEARTAEAPGTPAEGARRILGLIAALRVHDRRTRGHSERVRAYTEVIADELELDDDTRERLRWAGLLHDVGKLYVSADILNKTQHLTASEIAEIKTHPERGREIVADLVPWLGEESRAVWEHHERWDGTGYPAGLAGNEISLAGRIVCVADAYDVMTSARSYHHPMSPVDARAELTRCAGSHFDPMVVRAFMNASLGRVGRAAGPMTSLTHLAWFPVSAIALAGQSVGTLAGIAALGISAVGITGDGRPDPRPAREEAAAIASTTAPTTTTTTTATTATTTATTTTTTVAPSTTTSAPVPDVAVAKVAVTPPPPITASTKSPTPAPTPATTASPASVPPKSQRPATTAPPKSVPPKSQRPATTAPPKSVPPKSERPPTTVAPPTTSHRPPPPPTTGPPASLPVTVPTPVPISAPGHAPEPPPTLTDRVAPPVIAATRRADR